MTMVSGCWMLDAGPPFHPGLSRDVWCHRVSSIQYLASVRDWQRAGSP